MNNNKIQQIHKTDYEDTVPITNNSNILKWLINCQKKSFECSQKNLSKNLLVELKNLFGNHNKSLELESMTKIWTLRYNDLIFNIFTANGLGTSIEIYGYTFDEIRNGVKEKEIIEFLEELHKLINTKI